MQVLFCLNYGRVPIYRNKGLSDKKATLNKHRKSNLCWGQNLSQTCQWSMFSSTASGLPGELEIFMVQVSEYCKVVSWLQRLGHLHSPAVVLLSKLPKTESCLLTVTLTPLPSDWACSAFIDVVFSWWYILLSLILKGKTMAGALTSVFGSLECTASPAFKQWVRSGLYIVLLFSLLPWGFSPLG